MPKYTPYRVFINEINGGFPIVDNNGYFVLNANGEQMVGIDFNTVIQLGHPKSNHTHIFISKRQLVELRGVLDAAIFDLYEGQDMSSIFDTDIT
jgi:hypothetical protein